MHDGGSTSTNNWYWVSQGVDAPLQQGDLLLSVPTYAFAPEGDGPLEAEIVQGEEKLFLGKKKDLIVLSQSCDINGQKKGDIGLLLAPAFSFDDMPPSMTSPVMLEMIRQDKMSSYFMLDSCDISGYDFSHKVVDFRGVISLPLDLAYRYIKGGLKVIHMSSPYAEALGAAYGRSIMRVGLPSNIAAFDITDKNRKNFLRDFSLIDKSKRQEAIQELEDLASQLRNDIDEF